MKDTAYIFIKKYLGIIHRSRYLAISLGLSVLSVFTWGSFLWPKTYQAKTTVSIERTSRVNPLIQQEVRSTNITQDKLKNLTSEIKSKHIVEKAIEKMGLQTTEKGKSEALLSSMIRNLEIQVKGTRGETDLFNITFKGKDPKQVADFVSALTEVYINEYVITRREDTSETYEFIQSQLLEYKNRLEESDKEIRNFKEKNPTMVPQSENTLMSRLENIKTSEMDSNIRMNELIRKRENLRKQISGEKELTISFVTREGSPQARLNYLNNQLIILLGKYTENYPEVIKVKREIEELRKQIAQVKNEKIESSGSETASLNPIYQQLKEELSKTDAEIESLKGKLSELSRQQREVQRVFGLMPKEQEEWTKLQRDRNVYQQIYDKLLQKLEDARVSRELEQTNQGDIFKVVDPARVPTYPVSPDRFTMILLGLFLGIVSGIGIPLYIEHFDHTFKDEETIEKTLKLPVLSTIPLMVIDEDNQAITKRDRKIYLASGAYCAFIVLIMVGEYLSKYLGIKLIQF